MSSKKTTKGMNKVRLLVMALAAIFAVFAAAATGCSTARVPRGELGPIEGMPAAVAVVAPAQVGV